MALPDKELTAGQSSVMAIVLTNFQLAQTRLQSALQARDEAQAVMEEYIRQAADKLGVAVGTDYAFSLDQKKFIDKAAAGAADTAIPKQ